MINVTAVMGYLFQGCDLLILHLDNEEDKESVEESEQRVDSVIHTAVVLLGPAWQIS